MELNCIGEMCPMPVIKTKKALQELDGNNSLTVLVDNIEAVENIEKMLIEMGYPYTADKSGENFAININKTGAAVIPLENKIQTLTEPNEHPRKTVIIISSDKMGRGSDELGETLLKMFIYSLTEAETPPKALIFYNAGVKMTTEGSTSLESLDALLEIGVDILSCGACLKFYNLTKSLKVGRISNMYEISELMLNAANVITV